MFEARSYRVNKLSELFLRPIELEDIEDIKKWRNSKNVLPYVREYRLLSNYHVKNWYENMIMSDRFEMFIMQDGGEKVGISGLTYINWQNRHADLHFAIYKDDSWIDQIYAPEFYEKVVNYAFQELNLNKVYVEIYENDLKKKYFFESKGFKLDGRLRQHYYHKGEYLDSLIYSLLKEEK